MLQTRQACKAPQAGDPVRTENGHVFEGVSFRFTPQNEAAAFSSKFLHTEKRLIFLHERALLVKTALLKNPAISEVPDAC